MDDSSHVGRLLASIQGLPCWYVSCGGAVGSSFQLALGKKVARDTPVNNPAHPETYRNFEGEANLLVWCSWRLDDVDRPLTSSDDTSEGIVRGLGQLTNRTVEAVEGFPPAWDLNVRFSGGLNLRVFCDHVPPEPSMDGNWELWREDVVLAVGPGAQFEIEARRTPAISS